MSYNYCKDHRSGITYVYDVGKRYDEKTGKTISRRKLIGKLDDSGNIVPTSGRRGRLPKNQVHDLENEAQYQERIKSLNDEIAELKSTVAELKKEKLFLINSLEGILSEIRR